MDPARQPLLEVHADDMQQAENIFSMLMGETVEPRRVFIEQHALNVRNPTSKVEDAAVLRPSGGATGSSQAFWRGSSRPGEDSGLARSDGATAASWHLRDVVGAFGGNLDALQHAHRLPGEPATGGSVLDAGASES